MTGRGSREEGEVERDVGEVEMDGKEGAWVVVVDGNQYFL